MTYKCLVVDDEPLALKLIENHIDKIENLQVVATCNSAIKAFEILNTQQIDLLFLDIKMPNLTGIDFLKTLKNPPKTILTTAYRDYALEGFELEVVDYLLKPITFERFFKSVNRFLRNQSTVVSSHEKPTEKEYIIVKSGNKNHKILVGDILYIESLKDYIQFYLKDDKRVVSKYKISEIEQELNANEFLRVHRSYIIHKKEMTAFTSNEIEINGTEIPIGVSYKENVQQFLDGIR